MYNRVESCCSLNCNKILCVTSGYTLRIFFKFTLGFKLPVGDVNGPSLEAFRSSSRNLWPWGETDLAAVATLKEFLNDISMGKLLLDHC